MERDQLLKLSAKDVYGQAVRAGVEVAVKKQGAGIDKDALQKWYEDHPEFADEEVRVLMHQGSAESLAEVIQLAANIPGVVGVFNMSQKGVQYFET